MARSFCYLFCARPVGLNLQPSIGFSASSSSLPSLDTQLSLRCLISNLLRTLSPLGVCGITRHNISVGWPEKDPKQSRDRGRKTAEQRMLWMGAVQGQSHGNWIWCLGMGKNSRDFCCYLAAFEFKAFPRMRQMLSMLHGCVGVLYPW